MLKKWFTIKTYEILYGFPLQPTDLQHAKLLPLSTQTDKALVEIQFQPLEIQEMLPENHNLELFILLCTFLKHAANPYVTAKV